MHRYIFILLLSFWAFAADTQSPALIVSERMRQEEAAVRLREENVRRLKAAFVEIEQESDSKSKIDKLLSLRQEIQNAQNELKAASGRQVALLSKIDEASKGDILPQTKDVLDDARERLRVMGLRQEELKRQFAEMPKQVRQIIRNLPPPETFVNASGMKMRLVGDGKGAFYISEAPLGGNISYIQAVSKMLSLSNKENARYALPTEKEIATLKSADVKIDGAIWTSSVWEGAKGEEANTLARFDVVLHTIWDANGMLGRGEFFGELDFAHYPQLNVYAVTPANTGWLYRWNEINSK